MNVPDERMTAESDARSFAFGPFVLIPERQSLLQGGAPVRIGGRALDILAALVERPFELVSKRELMARVWPSTIVDESNLKVNVAALRRALGDGGPDDVRYIATVTGRGYKLIVPVTLGGPAESAPLAVAATRTHNLPTGTTRVLGRADAIDAIRRDFDVARLVSIVGPGGIGKTTVALAVAEHAIGAFRDGVWLIDLTLTKDPALTASAIAAALGVAGNTATMLSTLCASLREREMLLVLDSCEHLVEAAAACTGQLLAQAPGVKVLVTSREPLQLSGERVRRLPGLGTPPSSDNLAAEEALMFPAIQLFVDRATDRLDSFKLRDADAPAVADICRRLDGLALAIELAATRIDAFGVSGLLRQLDNRFRLLVGRRSGPERHRTLTATLGWSYSLLTAEEASLLCAVSVFAGMFDVAGASALSGMDPAQAADTLAQLSAKSLLVTHLDADAIAYRLLETTQTYCLEQLRAGGDEHRVRQRHAEHIYTTLDRAASEWAQRPAGEWETTYIHVLGDLRAALGWTGHDPQNGPLGIRLTVAGLLMWNHFSLTEECHLHVSHAVGQLEAAKLLGTAFEMKLALWLGCSTMFTRGLKQQALEAMRRALAIAVQIGDADYRLRCIMMIGIYELFTGAHAAGKRSMDNFAAVAMAEDPSALPEGDVHMGIAELFLGQLAASRRRLESLEQRDLRYFGSYSVRYLSDPLVLVRSVLTQVQWLTGSADSAMRTAAIAVDMARQIKHHLSLNNILSYACPVFYWSGQYDECERYVAMLEESVSRHGLAARRPLVTFYGAALAYTRGGASPASIAGLQQAIVEFRNINHLARMPYYLSVLADALAHGGRIDEAQATIVAALELAQVQQERWCLPEVLRIQAGLAGLQGQASEMEALLLNAMATASDTGAMWWRLRAACDLARLWQGGARAGEAHAMLSSVLEAFTEGFATRDYMVAAELIAGLAPLRSTVRTARQSG